MWVGKNGATPSRENSGEADITRRNTKALGQGGEAERKIWSPTWVRGDAKAAGVSDGKGGARTRGAKEI